MELPIASGQLLTTKHSWREFSIQSDRYCLGMRGKKCFMPRGRGLGGGSSHNAMFYVRGNSEDYDRWAELGGEGWSYKEVLPYFMKSEKAAPEMLQDKGYHGTNGPMSVRGQGFTQFSRTFVEAGKELGWEEVDINGKSQTGFSVAQQNVNPDGTRASTAKAFLRPAMRRGNLNVVVNAMVTKVLFDGKRAVGVEYYREGLHEKVFADREVIMSAGAINSPKLLMLSGVGPAEQLQKLGIPVVADLPVGENLQEHVMVDAVAATTDPGACMTFSAVNSVFELLKHKITGRSFLSCGATLDGTAFVRTESQPADRKAPFLQFHNFAKLLVGDPAAEKDIVQNGLSLSDELLRDTVLMNGEMEGKDGFHIVPTVIHPFSRGTVRLASVDPLQPALVDPNFLGDPRDVRIMIDGIRIAQRIVKTEAMKKIDTKVLKRPLTACGQHQYNSDTYWECYIRHASLTVYHSSGTCKMGRMDDVTAVVDPQLRVRGLEGLRVVDMSIAPEIPGGNTHAPAVMIGEKAADIIRDKITV